MLFEHKERTPQIGCNVYCFTKQVSSHSSSKFYVTNLFSFTYADYLNMLGYYASFWRYCARFFNLYFKLKDVLPRPRLSVRKIRVAGITRPKLSICIIYNNLGFICIIASFKQFQSICIIMLSCHVARIFFERYKQIWWFYWPATRTESYFENIFRYLSPRAMKLPVQRSCINKGK